MMAADMLGVTFEQLQPSSQDSIAIAFLMALAIIPIMALAANIMMTLRGADAFIENPPPPEWEGSDVLNTKDF